MAPARSILILSAGPLCRNPRVLKEATAIADAGLKVTVMTVANITRFEAYDAEILKTARFRKIALNLISRRGVSGARAIASRVATWLARHGARFGMQSKQALGPAAALGRMARHFEADLTIVHTELPMCIGPGLLARGRRVAADFEDWHSCDLLPGAQSIRPMQLIRNAERVLIRRSAYTSTTSHAMAHALQDALGGALPIAITNSFPLQPEPAPRPSASPPAFIWFSQTIGPGRGLEPFLAAWRETTHASCLTLLGDIDPAYRSKLIHRLPPERRDWLKFLPVTSPQNLPSVIEKHDVGLALELDFPTSKNCTISNKILQYLNAGLAVVASDTAGQREVAANSPGACILISLFQTSALTAQLDGIIADRMLLASMGRAARRAAVGMYCWERETPRLLNAVESALRSPVPRPSDEPAARHSPD